jgi:hypothetical protein
MRKKMIDVSSRTKCRRRRETENKKERGSGRIMESEVDKLEEG